MISVWGKWVVKNLEEIKTEVAPISADANRTRRQERPRSTTAIML